MTTNRSLKTLLGGLALALLLTVGIYSPAPAQDSFPASEAAAELTDLGWDLLKFSQLIDPERLPPRVDSPEEVEKSQHGWYLNEDDGFLYIAFYHTGCGCNTEVYRVAAFRKSGGGYLLVRSGDRWLCDSRIVAEADQPWAEILPPGFSLQNYFREGEKLRTDRAFFLIEVEIPEKGRELTLTARPMMNYLADYDPEAVFEPFKNRDFSVNAWETVNTYSGLVRHDFEKAVEDGLLPEFTGRTGYGPEDLERLAAGVLRAANIRSKMLETEPDPGQIAEMTRKLGLYYEIYEEYLRLGVKSFILEWSGADGRFQVKNKVVLDPPPSFLDFLITDGFIFATAC